MDRVRQLLHLDILALGKSFHVHDHKFNEFVCVAGAAVVVAAAAVLVAFQSDNTAATK